MSLLQKCTVILYYLTLATRLLLVFFCCTHHLLVSCSHVFVFWWWYPQTVWDPAVWATEGSSRAPPQVCPVWTGPTPPETMILAPILIHRQVKKPLLTKLYCSSSAQISLLPVMENSVSSRVLVDCSARYATASLQSDKQTWHAHKSLYGFQKRVFSTHFLLLCRPARCAVMK